MVPTYERYDARSPEARGLLGIVPTGRLTKRLAVRGLAGPEAPDVYDWKHFRALAGFTPPNRIRIATDLASLGSQEPSAAQNGTVIQTCRKCGAAHGAESANCYVCHARLSPDDRGDRVRSHGLVRTDGALAVAPDWRSEVTLRLQEYRKRQRRLREGPAQPELVFSEERGAETDKPAPSRAAYTAAYTAAAPVPAPAVAVQPPRRTFRRGTHRIERVEIDLLQPSLDFSGATSAAGAAGRAANWHAALVLPMASLHERRLAAMLDGALLLFAYGGFLSLFSALGGRLVASKLDAAVLMATLALFYGQYFALFTLFGGATPGMMWRGLRLATFDGGEPRLRHLAWRSFGYLVSAGTLMLGFLWALWDEDHLCWHDRISHTHLTWTADGISEADQGDPGGARGEEASRPVSTRPAECSDGTPVRRSTPGR